ncbi:MAG TPA: hypothetical protein VEL28_06290 [Candidatus Binatia bacterium]|nr:hypothetical protein [Candidatus Binatia bacterium]
MKRPRFALITASIGLTLLATSLALAAPVCLHDTVSPYYFAKLKLPKKASQTTTFHGIRTFGFARNVTGIASRNSSGQLLISLHAQTAGPDGNDFLLGWVASDATLAGNAFFDNDGDFVKDDGTLAMSIVDCDTVLLP